MNDIQTGRKGDARRGIQSVEIGLGILQVLSSAPDAMTLKEIASAARLPASNCHRYLVSFARKGFVVQDERTARYDLGPNLLQAGLAALGRLDPIGIATEELERLVEETGHTGMVVIWADAGPTIVRWIQGRQAVRTTLAPGSTLPVLTTATGQIFLSFLPRRQTLTLVARQKAGSRINPVALMKQVRVEGMALVSGDHIPGLNAAAIPVLDCAGEAAAVLTLISAAKPLSAETLKTLRDHGQRASSRLGWITRSSDAA